MLPNLKQRLIIALAILIGTLGWFMARDLVTAPTRGTGISLFDAHVGLIPAIFLMLAAGVPAIMLGIFASASGHPMSGIFAVAIALAIVAASAGGGDGWVQRSDLPSDLASLMIEMVIWQAGVVGMVLAVQFFRSPIRNRWPALAFSDHLGVDTKVRFPTVQSLCAGVTCVAVAAVLGYFLMQSLGAKQMFWGVLAAFTLGGLVAHLVFPTNNPVGVIFAPAVVALVAYGYAMFSFDTQDQLLHAWFNRTLPAGDRLPGLSLTLPIYYVSTGLAGAVLGMGWAQSILAGETVTPAQRPTAG